MMNSVVAVEGSSRKEVDVGVCIKVENSGRQRLLCLRRRAFTCLLEQSDAVLGSSEPVNASLFLHKNDLVNAAAFPLK